MSAVADLPSRWADDPYLVGEHAHQEVLAHVADDRALAAVLTTRRRGNGLLGLGGAASVARAIDHAIDELVAPGLAFGTLTTGAWEQLSARARAATGLSDEGRGWNWLVTREPLSRDREGAERLPDDDETAARIVECLAKAHPNASTSPDDDRMIGWWGVQEGDRLVAVVGAVERAPGLAPHLVSMGVDPDERRRGLAGRVLAAAVEDCLAVQPAAGPPMVSLGTYARNHRARKVYERLGFQLVHQLTSRDARA